MANHCEKTILKQFYSYKEQLLFPWKDGERERRKERRRREKERKEEKEVGNKGKRESKRASKNRRGNGGSPNRPLFALLLLY